jgi:hypothetical protein
MSDDDSETSIYDPTEPRPRTATARGLAPQRAASMQKHVEIATPTQVDPVPRDRSEPIRVISMKTPAAVDTGKQPVVVPPKQVVLRSLSELSDNRQRPLERMAPPRDPKEVRARRLRDYVIWGSLVVIVGSIVMLAVWFIAR